MKLDMPFKVIAFDLDGTLLDSQRQIRPSSIAAIDAVRNKGLDVVLVTGRHHMVTRPYHHQLELDTPAICCNGTYLYDFGRQQTLSVNPIEENDARHLLRLSEKHGIVARILTSEAINYMNPDRTLLFYKDWSETLPESLRPVIRHYEDYSELLAENPLIYSFVIVHPEWGVVRALERDIVAELGLSCEWFADDGFDVACAGNSKGGKLLEWAMERGIEPGEIMAFGDNHNDDSMLRAVGFGVAMGNAGEKIKSAADVVISGTNNSDAIAETLEQYVL